jgi:ferritin-like metal-binding protein YciE
MSDEPIKGEMAGYVFENVETATYAVLISAEDDPCDASQSSLRANLVWP